MSYIRALQGLYKRAGQAAPESEMVARIVHQCHYYYHIYLQWRQLDTVEALVRAACDVQETFQASVDYGHYTTRRPPPLSHMSRVVRGCRPHTPTKNEPLRLRPHERDVT